MRSANGVRMRLSFLWAALLLIVSACSAKPPAAAETAAEKNQTTADAYAPKPYVRLSHPAWSRSAVIYQLNTRQFTPEGTFAAAEKELPRLKDLGADIIWLMPIHPIGEKNRKGTLGSPYSVKDYLGVNPEFGAIEDLKSFVDAAHALGMRVILDWVANHTAWDNPLAEEHPDWYERDWKGDFHPTPWWDWSDIIDLDYSKPPLREYMTRAMKYWVTEAGIDGFRCDVAGYVPLDFWENARAELDAIKPVFMLAEFEQRDVHAAAFDATYAWSLSDAIQALAKGTADVGALFGYYSGNESAWPRDAYRMAYTSNHDFNSWHGTDEELYGDATAAAIVLTFVGEGIPLIYNGQEAGLDKRLAFFEKDPIVWRDHPNAELFRKLAALKHSTKALWNGAAGARMVSVVNTAPRKVFSFVRFGDDGGVFVVINFTPESQTVKFKERLHFGAYQEYFSGDETEFGNESEVQLEPWGYRVYLRK